MSRAVLVSWADRSHPEESRPDPDRVVSGDPVFTTWNRYESEDGKTFCGIWQSTPGAWRVVYEEWESCTLLEGRSVVTPDGGQALELGPGDSLVLEPGFRGVWTVIETTSKTYVIRL
jgi:uncharacterized cupin superfamily protein